MLGNDVQTSSTTADGGDDEAEPKPSSAGKWSDLIEALTKANQSGNEYISTILGSRAQMEAFCSDAAKKAQNNIVICLDRHNQCRYSSGERIVRRG